jgi:hypothetical protein
MENENEVYVDIGLTVVPTVYLHLSEDVPIPIQVSDIVSVRKKGEHSRISIKNDGVSCTLPVLEKKEVVIKAIERANQYHDAAVEMLKNLFKDVE